MRAEVDAAPREMRLALIRAHPQLAVARSMATASVAEQRGAGLDQCSREEFDAFQRLNAAYIARFGFPFIVAVKGLTRGDILAAFEARLANDPETEFATAIAQIHRIAGFRLAALFDPRDEPCSTTCAAATWTSPSPGLGAEVVYATDDFFADKARLIEPAEPVFIPGKYDDNGKWMDGWESRRKRDARPRLVRGPPGRARPRRGLRDRHAPLHRQLPAGRRDRGLPNATRRSRAKRPAGPRSRRGWR